MVNGHRQLAFGTCRLACGILSPESGICHLPSSVCHLESIHRVSYQVVVLGDAAIVRVPGEFLTLLGQEIKRPSPYRCTCVFEFANGDVGYIPDQIGFDRGG
jgi:hypothetical protein